MPEYSNIESFDPQHVRPIKRRGLDMQDDGVAIYKIAARINRTLDLVERLIG